MAGEKTVLIIGGGIAALSAAIALVEANQKIGSGKFKIHILTQAHRWGGKASSWVGGVKGMHVDLSMWPSDPDFTLNHGFHLIFDEHYYRNFWHMLRQAWNGARLRGQRPLDNLLYSNRHELLIYQKVSRRDQILHLQAKPSLVIHGSHLRSFATELLRSGSWTFSELRSLHRVVFKELFRYPTFRRLREIDDRIDPVTNRRYPDVTFRDWCLGHGLLKSIPNKPFFKFVFDASYVSPFDMDCASALKTLWGVFHNYSSTRWYYVQGGYSQDIFNPIHHYLHEHGVRCTMLAELRTFGRDGRRINGYEWREVDDHPDSSQERVYPDRATEEKFLTAKNSGKLSYMIEATRDEFDCEIPPPGEDVDYYISTLPLENFWTVLNESQLRETFPKVDQLRNRAYEKKQHSSGTVNLQAWFSRRVTNPRLKNFIGGLSPLSVMTDYKNFLPIYRDDARWPGSILELNGSQQDLQDRYPVEMEKLFGEDRRSDARGIQPTSPKRIDLAKRILIDMANDHGFPELRKAVEDDAFLEVADWKGRSRWLGDKIPPFLWFNVHEHNAYFMTTPGSLSLRPDISTPFENLFLAGDWTRNGIDVPCMEGAARSGRMAVLEILRKEQLSDLIEVYDPI